MLQAMSKLRGTATTTDVRLAAESILGVPEGSLEAKKRAIVQLAEEEMLRYVKEGGNHPYGTNV